MHVNINIERSLYSELYAYQIKSDLITRIVPSFQTLIQVFILLESRSFQIEVLTSGHEEITVVRLSPKAVQQAVEETFRKNIKVSNNYSLFWTAASGSI